MNLKEQLGEEGFTNIFGGKNNALVDMVIDIGSRGKVFKDVPLVMGGPISRLASLGTMGPSFVGAKITEAGAPGFIASQIRSGTGRTRLVAGAQRPFEFQTDIQGPQPTDFDNLVKKKKPSDFTSLFGFQPKARK